jgi:hypothetical protein
MLLHARDRRRRAAATATALRTLPRPSLPELLLAAARPSLATRNSLLPTAGAAPCELRLLARLRLLRLGGAAHVSRVGCGGGGVQERHGQEAGGQGPRDAAGGSKRRVRQDLHTHTHTHKHSRVLGSKQTRTRARTCT